MLWELVTRTCWPARCDREGLLLLGAAKIALRSAPSSLRLEGLTMPRRFLM